jgi:hypothetical protein
MDDWRVFASEAAAVGRRAITQKVARLDLSHDDLFDHALHMIKRSHDLTRLMMEKKLIAASPIE